MTPKPDGQDPRGDARRASSRNSGDAARAGKHRPVPFSDDSAARPKPEIPMPDGFSLEELAIQMGVEFLPEIDFSRAALLTAEHIPEKVARHFGVVAVAYDKAEDKLTVATSNPNNLEAVDTLRGLGFEITLALAPAKAIQDCLDRIFDDSEEHVPPIQEVNIRAPEHLARENEIDLPDHDSKTEPDIVRLVNAILRAALVKRASDASIEPQDGSLRVRLKIDGVLHELEPPPKLGWQTGIVSRLKVLGRADITLTHVDQGGSFRLKFKDVTYDVRLATLPTENGEMVNLRILDSRNAFYRLTDLGLSAANLATLTELITAPHGVILVTGPTGSGKTTTLYAGLQQRNNPENKIITIEDPVEYHIRGLNQVQVNDKVGMTFAAALRAVLRQTPNVVLFGEMRDRETAEITMRAALTGHLVFSTLHTIDAPSAITRLVDMHVDPALIAPALRAVVAQRLVRRLCTYCATEGEPDLATFAALGIPDEEMPGMVKLPNECQHCTDGYRGQIAIHEILVCDEAMQQAIVRRDGHSQLRQLAQTNGMTTLRQDGYEKASAGLTTFEEILRATTH